MSNEKIHECGRSIFTLVQSISYQIKIAGLPHENWPDWNNGLDFQVDIDQSGLATTMLTGMVDQAALIGLLRQLYTLGFPLISVNCIRSYEKERRMRLLSVDSRKQPPFGKGVMTCK